MDRKANKRTKLRTKTKTHEYAALLLQGNIIIQHVDINLVTSSINGKDTSSGNFSVYYKLLSLIERLGERPGNVCCFWKHAETIKMTAVDEKD